MAIAFDNSVSLGNSATTVSASGFVTTGSDIYLFVGILQDSSTAPSGTYNGGAITFGTGTQATLAGGSYYVFIGIRAVGAGVTGDISVTKGAGATDIWGDAASYSGVGATSGETGADVEGAADYTMTVNVTVANSWVVGYAYDSDGTASIASVSAADCVRRQLNSAAGIVAIFDSDAARGTGNQVLTVTHTTGPSTYRALALEPTGGGGPVTVGLSGSASTGGHGTSVPDFQIPL